MKKKNLKSLNLNKKSISILKVEKIKGGETSDPRISYCCLVKEG